MNNTKWQNLFLAVKPLINPQVNDKKAVEKVILAVTSTLPTGGQAKGEILILQKSNSCKIPRPSRILE